MVLIQGFRATNVWNAFILNSLASSLVILIAMLAKNKYDIYKDRRGRIITRITPLKSIVFTFIITFLASMTAYAILNYTFGFGGGMLVEE